MIKKLKLCSAAAAVGVCFLGLSQADAGTIGYTLDINNPVFNSLDGNENVPDIKITNTSSTAFISGFSLTIGDTNYSYGFIRNESAPTDTNSDLTRTSPADTNNDGFGVATLAASFTGFDPGDMYQFEVDIDQLTDWHADYRYVMFPDAVFTVSFSDGQTLSETLNPGDVNQAGYSFSQTKTDPIPQPPTADIPEPGTLALFGFGLAGLGFARRRKVA